MIYLIIIIVFIGGYILYVYNRLITLKNRLEESLSDIDVQLKRRYDLIPNLVETVKGYAKHERDLFEKITSLRTQAMQNTDVISKEGVEKELGNTVKSLFAVAENYPDLKANENFLQLQKDITDTEDKIQAARRFYNTNVLAFNTAIKVFPNSIIANHFNYKKADFFNIEENEKSNINIKI